MITCSACGHDNDAHDTACASCGGSLDDASARQLIGQVVLGVYEITDVLGQGGMSVVYKARHRMTDQQVALKILPPELAAHGALRTRFLEEAKALARLEHPNIVHLYNFGEEGGRFVLAMQYVDGQTFEKMIFRAGRLAWQEATRVICEILRALEYAHGRGIVHRDIKPSNILVRPDGSATVMDFGIAKMHESSRLTATGQTMGTVRYMSPEQVKGQSVDLRTDLYSLGITLFEAVVGDTPFDGETHFAIMSKHLSEAPPSPRGLGAEIPDDLDRVILRSLQKERDQRFASAQEFREALESIDQGPLRALAAPPPGRAGLGPPAEAAKQATSVVTGLASTLEPTVGAPALRQRPRIALWAGLAIAVAGAGAGVIVLLQRGAGGSAGAPADGVAAAADAAAPVPRGWPDPPAFADLALATDQKFGGGEKVRVLAAEKKDAVHLASTYVAARKRFIDFAARQKVDAAVEIHPLNLFIVPARIMCDKRISAPEPVPRNCVNLGYYYEPRSATLFVTDDESTEVQSIPEGVATHLCLTTAALRDRCDALLTPYFDEVESGLE